ncbi:DUF6090 family protein [Ascidiimonas aurantiaca]|uniref:DUF6090 family protein n=1 Tax=Ascidiimonas aurantiaca TaxID=1685432 RepID=UPI0030EEC5AE
MPGIFRKQKLNLLQLRKFYKYLLYALGEIVLVVIGILIAVNINNHNERKKQRDTYKSILSTVRLDLVSDSVESFYYQEKFREREDLLDRVLKGEFKKQQYDSCPNCANIITNFTPFTIETKGFHMLENHVDDSRFGVDSLASGIVQFYRYFIGYNDLIGGYLKEDVAANLKHWKESYPWFHLETEEKITNEAFMKYLMESNDYKNRIYYQKNLYTSNYIPLLNGFNQVSDTLIKMIDQKLKEL